jgi:hypothetical protein
MVLGHRDYSWNLGRGRGCFFSNLLLFRVGNCRGIDRFLNWVSVWCGSLSSEASAHFGKNRLFLHDGGGIHVLGRLFHFLGSLFYRLLLFLGARSFLLGRFLGDNFGGFLCWGQMASNKIEESLIEVRTVLLRLFLLG